MDTHHRSDPLRDTSGKGWARKAPRRGLAPRQSCTAPSTEAKVRSRSTRSRCINMFKATQDRNTIVDLKVGAVTTGSVPGPRGPAASR